MTQDELCVAVGWAAAEGWNPGIHDAAAFYAADPNGFFLALVDGEPVGSVSAVAYNDSFGFMGFFIVRPESRGQGIGEKLGEAGLRYLGKRNIGLDAVLEQQPRYERAGFRRAYRNIRWQGEAKAGRTSPECTELSRVPFTAIAAYDDRLFPAPRHRFLREWIKQPGAIALGILKKDGSLCGYGVIRPCRTGYKLGPLFADDTAAAHTLYESLTAAVPPGTPVFLDTPDRNREAAALARNYNLEPVFETARMYNRGEPPVPLERWYGVTSFELG